MLARQINEGEQDGDGGLEGMVPVSKQSSHVASVREKNQQECRDDTKGEEERTVLYCNNSLTTVKLHCARVRFVLQRTGKLQELTLCGLLVTTPYCGHHPYLHVRPLLHVYGDRFVVWAIIKCTASTQQKVIFYCTF